MVQIPNLPTDSLYKFMALGGLTGAIVLIIFMHFELNKVSSDIYKLSEEVAKESVEMEYIVDDTTLLKEKISALETFINSAEKKKHLSKNEMKNLKNTFQKLDSISQALKEKTKEIRSKNKIFEVRASELKNRNAQLAEFVRNKYWIVFYLMALSLLGFFLWYFKIQRYQDIIIKKQAESLNTKE